MRHPSDRQVFSIFVICSDKSASAVDRTLKSLRAQKYSDFEVMLVGVDPGKMEATSLAKLDVRFEPNLGSSNILSMDGLRIPRGDYFLALAGGDVLLPGALKAIASKLVEHPHTPPEIVIFDFHHPGAGGRRFLPGWDPDLIEYCDYVQSAYCASVEFARRIAKHVSFSRSFDWLRYVAQRDVRVLHIARPLLVSQRTSVDRVPFEPRIQVPLKFSVVIPDRNGVLLLPACTEVFYKLREHIELIVVDNRSDDPAVHAIYKRLQEDLGAIILRFDRSFNYAAMVNAGVRAAQHELVLLLNNDVTISDPDSLHAAAQYIARPNMGAVGSLLRYPDGSVQHAGMVLSVSEKGYCDTSHLLRYANTDEGAFIGALTAPHNWLSVTGAFQFVRKSIFESLGGYDEVNLPVEFNDVDFCLRVKSAGFRVVCLPLRGVVHDESKTRSKMNSQKASLLTSDAYQLMCCRWRDIYRNDPHFNEGLRSPRSYGETVTQWCRSRLPRMAALWSILASARIGKTEHEHAHYLDRVRMETKLREGVCLISPSELGIASRMAMQAVTSACDECNIELSVFDCASIRQRRQTKSPADNAVPFPDRLVNIYFGNADNLECDRPLLGEGRTNVLYLCNSGTIFSTKFIQILQDFKEIWSGRELDDFPKQAVSHLAFREVPSQEDSREAAEWLRLALQSICRESEIVVQRQRRP